MDMKPKLLPPRTQMERAMLESDAAYEGVFFTAVKTTGIFCRPTCRARKPKPENCDFFATADEAIVAGFRPCLRCKPLQIAGDAPEWVRPVIALIDGQTTKFLSNTQIEALGIDPDRVRRWFKAKYGMTFHQYARARRLASSLTNLRAGETLDNAAFDSGYESLSGYRDAVRTQFGATPSEAAQKIVLWFTHVPTPLGTMVAAAEDRGLVLLEWVDRPILADEFTMLKKSFGYAPAPGAHPTLTQITRELAEYFAGTRTVFETPTFAPGTPFEKTVWTALQTIPYGQTRSYGQLAAAIGKPSASRAVGAANGRNRLAVIIPCHRVIGANGDLVGYAAGQPRKAFLLDLERGGRTPQPTLF